MNPFKLLFTALIVFILMPSCIDYADEEIIVNGETPPGFAVYKTKKDYYDYVYVGIDSNNNITSTPFYNSKSPLISQNKSGDYYYNQRWKLRNKYVVSKEIHLNVAFTNITYNELVNYVDENGINIPNEWFSDRIIDSDPFVSLYSLRNNPTSKNFTLGEINEMIENETIETVFTKIK